jgi:alpha-1,6-mannosyltransferase
MQDCDLGPSGLGRSMRLKIPPPVVLVLIGGASIGPYAYALAIGDLREHTILFECTFFIAFALYAVAVGWIARATAMASTSMMATIFVFAVLYRGILIVSQPTLSDDMYRYVWDGRVQASGISPYAYPPDSPEEAGLRDATIWPRINRPSAVTVYPAAAEIAFGWLWRIWPDNIHWFQAAMATADLVAGGLLLVLLRALGRNPLFSLVYLWSPLVIFETAHSGHVDGLVLPFIVGAFLASARRRETLAGVLLGIATGLKFYPALLLPVLWRKRETSASARAGVGMPLGFLVGFLAPYLRYLSQGAGVVGYLPNYLRERFNLGLDYFIIQGAERIGALSDHVILGLLAAALAIIYLAFFLRPALDAESALRRCMWPMGVFTLLSQDLFPWYLLWMVPVLALLLSQVCRMGMPRWTSLLESAWSAWWLFTGLVALAYTFFIHWRPVPLAQWIEFSPLYALLIVSLLLHLRQRGWAPFETRLEPGDDR